MTDREAKAMKKKKNKALQFILNQNESKLEKFVTQISKIFSYQIKNSNEEGSSAWDEANAFNESEFLPSLNLISSSGSFAGKSLYPVYIFNLNEIKDEDKSCICEDTDYFHSSSSHVWLKIKKNKENENNFGNIRKRIADLILKVSNSLKFDFETVVIAMIYIERLTSKTKIRLNSENWKSILLSSLILASKFWEDCRFSNNDFVEFSNFSITNIFIMEIRWAQFLNYEMFVGKAEYDSFLSRNQLWYNNIKRHEKSKQKREEYRKYGIMKSFKNKCTSLIN